MKKFTPLLWQVFVRKSVNVAQRFQKCCPGPDRCPINGREWMSQRYFAGVHAGQQLAHVETNAKLNH